MTETRDASQSPRKLATSDPGATSKSSRHPNDAGRSCHAATAPRRATPAAAAATAPLTVTPTYPTAVENGIQSAAEAVVVHDPELGEVVIPAWIPERARQAYLDGRRDGRAHAAKNPLPREVIRDFLEFMARTA